MPASRRRSARVTIQVLLFAAVVGLLFTLPLLLAAKGKGKGKSRNNKGAADEIFLRTLRDAKGGSTVGPPLGAVDPDGDTLTYRLFDESVPGLLQIDQEGQVSLMDDADLSILDVNTVTFKLSVGDGKAETVSNARLVLHHGTCSACASIVEEMHHWLNDKFEAANPVDGSGKTLFYNLNMLDMAKTVCSSRDELLGAAEYVETCSHLSGNFSSLLASSFSGDKLKPAWGNINPRKTYTRIASLCNATIPYCRDRRPGSRHFFSRIKKDKCARCVSVAKDLQRQYNKLETAVERAFHVRTMASPAALPVEELRAELRKRGLQVQGLRPDLIRRLAEARQKEGASAGLTAPGRGQIASLLEVACQSLPMHHPPQIASNLVYTCEELVEDHADELIDRIMDSTQLSFPIELCGGSMSGMCASSALTEQIEHGWDSPWRPAPGALLPAAARSEL